MTYEPALRCAAPHPHGFIIECDERRAATSKPRFRFVGRNGSTYVWESLSSPPAGVRPDRVKANVCWFWRHTGFRPRLASETATKGCVP